MKRFRNEGREPFSSDEDGLVLVEGPHRSIGLVSNRVNVRSPFLCEGVAVVRIGGEEVGCVNGKALIGIDGDENRS